MAKCKQCKKKNEKEDTLYLNLKAFCNMECAIKYGKANIKTGKKLEQKEYNKVTAGLKKKFGLNKVSDKERAKRERATKEACHAYIRMRDKGSSCICCPEGSLIDVVHAGHFKASDKYAILRYDEDNIHAQRAHCNMYQGGDSGLYEFNLRNKIGNQRVDELYMKIEGSSNVYKHTIDDLKRIEQYYKDKLKQLINGVTE